MVVAALALAAATSPVPARADDLTPLVALIDAAAQRLQTADPVAAYKWVNNVPVDDPARVQQVLAAVSADANDSHVDADYVRRAFNDQINATDAIEYTRFAQWKFDPANAPTAAPGLSASRSTIDTLNIRMVGEIAAQWELLHSPACGTELSDARDAVIAARGLDPLYQQALSFATRSYCAG
jgi:chorismate mutase